LSYWVWIRQRYLLRATLNLPFGKKHRLVPRYVAEAAPIMIVSRLLRVANHHRHAGMTTSCENALKV
jgi:hypothetical protein